MTALLLRGFRPATPFADPELGSLSVIIGPASSGGGGGVTDGDKGDIVVSGSGAVWSFDSAVVTAFARTILDDADAGTVRTTLGLGTAATAATGDFAAASHTHSIANVTGLQTALDGKEASITAGTTGQYWRGDKTWQTLNKAAVGLSSVDNTADADKPVSTATQTALNLKLNASAVSVFGLTLIDDADASTARTTLGLGTAAVAATGDFAAAAHVGSGGTAHANAIAAGAAGFMTGADKTKLDGIATGATAVSNSDIRAQVEAELVAGTNVTITPSGSGASRQLTIAATGGGGGGSGDVVGPASATDNALARFDTTTGKLLQNSAVTCSDDGVLASATNSGANAVRVPLANWIKQTADRTLTSTTSLQQIFDTTTNGALTLPTGVYEFSFMLRVTNMSTTTGNASVDILGAGTAVTTEWGWQAVGGDNNNLASGNAAGYTQSLDNDSPSSITQLSTATNLAVDGRGIFEITTAGTIIPSLALVTAAAATVVAGAWFRIMKIGETGENSVGAWT